MPAVALSRVGARVVESGPGGQELAAEAWQRLEALPDPRSPQGRIYPLACLIAIAVCAFTAAGNDRLTAVGQWIKRASQADLARLRAPWDPLGARYRAPDEKTVRVVLDRLDPRALAGALLGPRPRGRRRPGGPSPASARRYRARRAAQQATALARDRLRAVAVDGKTSRGARRADSTRVHLLGAAEQGGRPLDHLEVGVKHNETSHFTELLRPLDLDGAVVTSDALHTVRANLDWLVMEKKAHFIAIVKRNQPLLHAQVRALPWRQVPAGSITRDTGHGRIETRTLKTAHVRRVRFQRNTLPGVLDDALLADWCLRYLGAPFERVLFRSGYLSDVVGVELSSGLRAVVKARPCQSRIAGCLQVQAALARVGFPCPEPLTVATRVHGMTVTAETEVPGGSPLPTEAGPAPFAALLARLIASAPAPAAVPDLAPSPPWTGWDHPGRRLWPDLDEHGQDLNLVGAPEWVDDAARRVRERLTSTPGRLCIGHGDWESQNIRWTGRDPLVVHDWDSVIAQPEPAIVGLAAAMWPRADETASVAQTAEFITSYQLQAGREWDRWEIRDAWASGLWVRLIYAKQEAAEGGSQQLDRLATEIDERLDHAALI